MSSQRIAFDGNPFIGLYVRASDKMAFLPPNSPEKFLARCGETLGKVEFLTIGGSHLLGLFSAINSRGVVVPRLIFKEEAQELKKLGLNVAEIRSRFTAVGNNVLVNDRAALVNPELPQADVKAIAEELDVEVVPGQIAGYNTVGSMAVVTNKGLLVNANATEEEMGELEKLFGVKGNGGTANMGVSFVGISLAANSRGCVAGELTSGFEMSRIDEALGFV